MKPIILFRSPRFLQRDPSIQDEYSVCASTTGLYDIRCAIPPDSLVVGRYSVLPMYREVWADLMHHDSRLINDPHQHELVADITQWYPLLHDLTPATHTEWGSLTQGPWVVKGRTNSRKFRWNTHMFAENREQLLQTVGRLLDDGFIADQGLVVRQYVPLRQLGTGLNGLPISNEWRYFVLNRQILAHGFYWHECEELAEDPGRVGELLVMEAAARINTPFMVVDIAQTAEGYWIVMELNDGQMSGLSTIDPTRFYTELARRLT
jgi:hypothetical protein